MASVRLVALICRLSPITLRALKGARELCRSRTNYSVDIEHWLTKILETSGSDLERALGTLEIDPARFNAKLQQTLDRMETGNTISPDLSPDIVRLAEAAWLTASLEFDSPRICSGHLLLTLLLDENLARAAEDPSKALGNISIEALRSQLGQIAQDSAEAGQAPRPSEVIEKVDLWEIDPDLANTLEIKRQMGAIKGGDGITFFEFCDLILESAKVAARIRDWFGYQVVPSADGVVLRDQQGGEVSLQTVHDAIQADSERRYTIYQMAMDLWR